MKGNVFTNVDAVTRGGDELSAHYTTTDIVKRIWSEHLRPHVFLLSMATVAMLLTAVLMPLGTSGRQQDGDEPGIQDAEEYRRRMQDVLDSIPE